MENNVNVQVKLNNKWLEFELNIKEDFEKCFELLNELNETEDTESIEEVETIITILNKWNDEKIASASYTIEKDTMYDTLLVDEFEDKINNMLECEELDFIVQWYNETEQYQDVFDMNELDIILENMSPSEIINKVYYGGNEFNPNHSFFKFDGYANLQSLTEYDYIDEFLNESIQSYFNDEFDLYH